MGRMQGRAMAAAGCRTQPTVFGQGTFRQGTATRHGTVRRSLDRGSARLAGAGPGLSALRRVGRGHFTDRRGEHFTDRRGNNVATAPTIRTATGLPLAGFVWNFPRQVVTIESHRASD